MVMTLNSIQGLSIRRNIQCRIWKVSHTPEHPTPRVRLVTGEGGGGGGATARKLRFKTVELAAGIRSFRRRKWAGLGRGDEASRTGPEQRFDMHTVDATDKAFGSFSVNPKGQQQKSNSQSSGTKKNWNGKGKKWDSKPQSQQKSFANPAQNSTSAGFMKQDTVKPQCKV
ncbi:hypothetical protein L3X38_007949 [Prunus dulcis]|uniref:Uncharacterized protein n=1 Tax=Prunus dulcis TaxID=3755 RepID=A0AAD5F6J1_PRUDU|nr:hypothetical protein L3X38_007949 [Prunus dulcis]